MSYKQKQYCFFILKYEDGTELKSSAFGAPEYVEKFQYVGRNGLIDVEFYNYNYTEKLKFNKEEKVIIPLTFKKEKRP